MSNICVNSANMSYVWVYLVNVNGGSIFLEKHMMEHNNKVRFILSYL